MEDTVNKSQVLVTKVPGIFFFLSSVMGLDTRNGDGTELAHDFRDEVCVFRHEIWRVFAFLYIPIMILKHLKKGGGVENVFIERKNTFN